MANLIRTDEPPKVVRIFRHRSTPPAAPVTPTSTGGQVWPRGK